MCAILLDIYVRVGMTGIQEKLILSESKIRKDCWPLVQLPTVHKCPYNYHHLQEEEFLILSGKLVMQVGHLHS